jgi:uncharacterized coiled-coil DUF342 family protein
MTLNELRQQYATICAQIGDLECNKLKLEAKLGTLYAKVAELDQTAAVLRSEAVKQATAKVLKEQAPILEKLSDDPVSGAV